MRLSRLASTTVRNHTSPRPSTLAKRFETASKPFTEPRGSGFDVHSRSTPPVGHLRLTWHEAAYRPTSARSVFGPSDARPLRPRWALSRTGDPGRKRNDCFSRWKPWKAAAGRPGRSIPALRLGGL